MVQIDLEGVEQKLARSTGVISVAAQRALAGEEGAGAHLVARREDLDPGAAERCAASARADVRLALWSNPACPEMLRTRACRAVREEDEAVALVAHLQTGWALLRLVRRFPASTAVRIAVLRNTALSDRGAFFLLAPLLRAGPSDAETLAAGMQALTDRPALWERALSIAQGRYVTGLVALVARARVHHAPEADPALWDRCAQCLVGLIAGAVVATDRGEESAGELSYLLASLLHEVGRLDLLTAGQHAAIADHLRQLDLAPCLLERELRQVFSLEPTPEEAERLARAVQASTDPSWLSSVADDRHLPHPVAEALLRNPATPTPAADAVIRTQFRHNELVALALRPWDRMLAAGVFSRSPGLVEHSTDPAGYAALVLAQLDVVNKTTPDPRRYACLTRFLDQEQLRDLSWPFLVRLLGEEEVVDEVVAEVLAPFLEGDLRTLTAEVAPAFTGTLGELERVLAGLAGPVPRQRRPASA